MKSTFWIGLALLLLGILSLFVPIRSTEQNNVEVVGIRVGVETQHRETISPFISALVILWAGGMMLVGQVKAMGIR